MVQIEYPRQGLWTMGLVAAERIDTLHLAPSPSILTIDIATTPNPTSGVLVMVPPEEVFAVDDSPMEALTFIVSFGIVGKHLQQSSSAPATPPRPRPPAPPQPTRLGRTR